MSRGKKSLLSKEAKAAIKNAKLAKKRATNIYKAQIKEMRPYLSRLKEIDLRKELSPAQKSYISKAWSEYQELTLRPTKIFRTRNKKKLKLVQNISRHSGQVKFDVAFVPTAAADGKLEIKGDALIIKSKYVDQYEVRFNMLAMARDPAKEMQRIIDKYPECKQFALMAGKYIWNGGISPEIFVEKVIPLLERYMPGGAGLEKRGPNSLYTNWALGVYGFKGQTQKDVRNFIHEYHQTKDAQKKQRRKVRRQRQVKYGKKF